MRLIFDQGEAKLIWDHVVSLFVPGRLPAVPDTYREIDPGSLDAWTRRSLDLLVEEGRRRLDAANLQFEAVRSRSQFVLGTSLAAGAALVGGLGTIVDNLIAFIAWVVAMAALVLAVVVSFATFASTAQLGSVDPVLLSQEDGGDGTELTRSLANAYVEAVQASINALNVRFTLYRDAIWFLVTSLTVGISTWGFAISRG